MTGTLFVVATPIGNLDDLSPRASQVLAQADLVACEDTRHSGRLLSHLGIKKRLVSLHEHNETRRIPRLLDELETGISIALISDAGTPLMSDPGYPLVRATIEAGHRVVPVPGPSAALAALVASGLPPYPHTFCGFPPPKRSRRRKFFERFSELDHTLIFFEGPHRVLASLADALETFGDRRAAVARELTKMHEEIVRGSLSEIHAELAARPTVKGEFCVVVGSSPQPKDDDFKASPC